MQHVCFARAIPISTKLHVWNSTNASNFGQGHSHSNRTPLLKNTLGAKNIIICVWLVQCLQLHSLATPQTRAIPMNAINSRRGPSHSKQGENSRLLLNQNSEYYKYKNVRFARPVSMTTSPPASNPTNATTRRLGPSHSTLEKILSNFKNPEGERAKIISLEKNCAMPGLKYRVGSLGWWPEFWQDWRCIWVLVS